MIISFSEVFKWDTCNRQYYYNFILGVQPQEGSVAMDIGTKGHKLLQSFYTLMSEGKTQEEAQVITRQNANNLLRNESMEEMSALLTSATLVDNYIRSTDFKSKAILVENRFLIPVEMVAPEFLVEEYGLQGVQIGFTPDVVFERAGGFCDVEDSKFVGRAWSQKKMNRCPQAKLYQTFLMKMGYKISRSTLRFFNTTTGKVTSKNYELFPAEEKILISDFIRTVGEVVKYREQSSELHPFTRRTMNYTTCQFCYYETPCTLEAEGKDASKTLKYQFRKNDYDYSK